MFGLIFDRYFEKIYRFVFLKITDKEKSEDIVSDVFTSALNWINRFRIDDSSSVSAWLYRIANNKVIDYYKSNKETIELDNNLELAYNSDLWRDIDARDKLKSVLEYIKSLEKDKRDVLLYRFWEDMSYNDIGELTWLSVSNCKQIVSRTIKNITVNFVFLLFILLII